MIFVSIKSLVQVVYIVPAVQIVFVPVARDLRRFLPAVIVSPLSNKKAALRRLCALCGGRLYRYCLVGLVYSYI